MHRCNHVESVVGFVHRRAFTLIELLVVIGIIGVLIAISVPAVQHVRSAAQRTTCGNHLRQVGLALQNYYSAHRHFPAGITGSDHPRHPGRSYLTAILPYIEQGNLSDVSQREFDAGHHFSYHVGMQTVVPVYQCPSDPRSGRPQFTHRNRLVTTTSYMGVCGTDYTTEDGVLYRDSRITVRNIPDGLSQTLLVGERPPSSDNWYGWWYAGAGQLSSGSPDMLLGALERNDGARHAESCSEGPYRFGPGDLEEQCDLFHFWSLHAGGGHFLMCDGSTHFVSYQVDADLIPALATRAGGEVSAFPE